MTISESYQTLAAAPAAFRALLATAAPEAVAFRESPTSWNAHEVLCHVTDGEVTDWRPRIDIVLSDGGDKRFTPFDREGGFRRYGNWPLAALLDEFERLRRENLSHVARLNLDEAALARTGIHPEFGNVTLTQLLVCWAVHDLAHINQISRGFVRRLGPQIGPWTKYFSLLAT